MVAWDDEEPMCPSLKVLSHLADIRSASPEEFEQHALQRCQIDASLIGCEDGVDLTSSLSTTVE